MRAIHIHIRTYTIINSSHLVLYTNAETITIDLTLRQTIHKIDQTFMVILTAHQTYSLIRPHLITV